METDVVTFQDVVAEHDNIKVVLEHIGEGINGEFDPEDPNDVPLIRFTIYKDGEQVDDASYCTNLSIHEDRLQLEEIAMEILGCVYLPLLHGQSIKKMCEKLSHIEVE